MLGGNQFHASQKISQVWWHTHVVLATQKAETEESLEPERERIDIRRN